MIDKVLEAKTSALADDTGTVMPSALVDDTGTVRILLKDPVEDFESEDGLESVQGGSEVILEESDADKFEDVDIQVPEALESVDFDYNNYEQDASVLPMTRSQQLPGGYSVPPPSLLNKQSNMTVPFLDLDLKQSSRRPADEVDKVGTLYNGDVDNAVQRNREGDDSQAAVWEEPHLAFLGDLEGEDFEGSWLYEGDDSDVLQDDAATSDSELNPGHDGLPSADYDAAVPAPQQSYHQEGRWVSPNAVPGQQQQDKRLTVDRDINDAPDNVLVQEDEAAHPLKALHYDTTSHAGGEDEGEKEIDGKASLESLRSALQDRYEEVLQYMELEREAVQEMERRESEAQGSTQLNMLYRLQKDFQNAKTRALKEKREARGKVHC
jgi:hypothetical protein